MIRYTWLANATLLFSCRREVRKLSRFSSETLCPRIGLHRANRIGVVAAEIGSRAVGSRAEYADTVIMHSHSFCTAGNAATVDAPPPVEAVPAVEAVPVLEVVDDTAGASTRTNRDNGSADTVPDAAIQMSLSIDGRGQLPIVALVLFPARTAVTLYCSVDCGDAWMTVGE